MDGIICNIKEKFSQMDEKKGLVFTQDGAKNGEHWILHEIRDEGQYVFFGLGKLQTEEGPAKGDTNGNLEPMPFNDGEGVDYLSAAMYVRETAAFIVEESKTSLKAEQLIEHLQHYKNESHFTKIAILPVIEHKTLNQLRKGAIINRFNCKINLPKIRESDYYSDDSLRDILSWASDDDLTIEIKVKASANKSIGQKFYNIMEALLSKFDQSAVPKLELYYKNPSDTKFTILDLINARVKTIVEANLGSHRYVTFSERYTHLKASYDMWKDSHYN